MSTTSLKRDVIGRTWCLSLRLKLWDTGVKQENFSQTLEEKNIARIIFLQKKSILRASHFQFVAFRSGRPKVFCKKGALSNFSKFTRKHLCQTLFVNNVARPATLLKKRLLHRCFPVNFEKFIRTPFFIEHLWWLLLHVSFYIEDKIYSGFNSKGNKKRYAL